jgi:hypothetical protein
MIRSVCSLCPIAHVSGLHHITSRRKFVHLPRMQLIIPQKRIRTLPSTLIRTNCPVQVTMDAQSPSHSLAHSRSNKPSDDHRYRSSTATHRTTQTPHQGYGFATQDLERRLVFIHIVHRSDVLVHHHVRDLRLVGRHVGPVVVRARAVERCSWHTAGGEVEGCDIQEDEEAAAGGIEGCRGMRRCISM